MPIGELEAHGGSGEEYGSCVRENDGCAEIRKMGFRHYLRMI
jgi:hypothetical protein